MTLLELEYLFGGLNIVEGDCCVVRASAKKFSIQVTELDLVDAGVTRAQSCDLWDIVSGRSGLTALVGQVRHRVQANVAFLVACRQNCVRQVEADRSSRRSLRGTTLCIHERDRSA